jgi:hypothetical protein
MNSRGRKRSRAHRVGARVLCVGPSRGRVARSLHGAESGGWRAVGCSRAGRAPGGGARPGGGAGGGASRRVPGGRGFGSGRRAGRSARTARRGRASAYASRASGGMGSTPRRGCSGACLGVAEAWQRAGKLLAPGFLRRRMSEIAGRGEERTGGWRLGEGRNTARVRERSSGRSAGP